MINQAQYNALCAVVAEGGNLNLAREAVADLLESFEVLHAALDNLCTRDCRPGLDAFEALTDERGNMRVQLVCHGRAPKQQSWQPAPGPFPYRLDDRGWKAV